jgi:uncharacterized membrane protein YqaE (UPF0057 family)
MIEGQLHLSSFILIIIAIAIPAYLVLKLKGNLRILAMLLTIFVSVHGVYHIFGALGFEFLADNIFEPASVAVLILFELTFLSKTRTRREIKR